MIISLTKVGTSSICLTEGVLKSTPHPVSHRARQRKRGHRHSNQASPHPVTLRATAPVGGGEGVLSNLLLVLRVDRTHQKQYISANVPVYMAQIEISLTKIVAKWGINLLLPYFAKVLKM